MKNGEVKDNGRWCESHQQFHGLLHCCEKYPQELLDELEIKNLKHVENLRSKKWCEKQMKESGIDVFGIMTFRAFAGIDPDDWTE